MSAVDRKIVQSLELWFTTNQRALPWREVDARLGRRDAWRSLVSEIMLQQTQVSRVAERFDAFLDKFPNAKAMSRAGEDAVLAAWSGMGYYRRARSLYKASVVIDQRFGGEVPSAVDDLRSLPGVGAYTAGAIASVVFGARVPLVDANVTRVVLRLEGKKIAASSKEARALSWERAASLVEAAEQPGVLNEALMELGALVCLPRGARCNECPLRTHCVAGRVGWADRIPATSIAAVRTQVVHASVVIRDRRGRVFLEQRDVSGLWAGMWQPVTAERARAPRGVSTVVQETKLKIQSQGASRSSAFVHGTSSKMVRFVSWSVEDVDSRIVRAGGRRRWFEVVAAQGLALGSPQRRVLREAGVFD